MFEKIKCFILDMDGTIYLGNELFSFTKEFLKKVDETGRKYYFFGNNRTGWKTARIIGKIYQRGTTSGRHCENRKLCVL